MTSDRIPRNRVREIRAAAGLTQATLAKLSGISRTAVTAIEGGRLVPSVAAAIAIAETLGTTVEELFGGRQTAASVECWAYRSETTRDYWRAEVDGRTVLYPAGSAPMWTPLPDDVTGVSTAAPSETLVMASCDPAAGLLASCFSEITGQRLIILSRSSGESLEMLRQGLVHLAGVHFATTENPDANHQSARGSIGTELELMRLASWQTGIAYSPRHHFSSIRAARKAQLNWIGRLPGTAALTCEQQILEDKFQPEISARDHRSVASAICLGVADAGVCVQLVAAEAGICFLPVRRELHDVCYHAHFRNDRRLRAFQQVVRSKTYQKLVSGLSGYDPSESGRLV